MEGGADREGEVGGPLVCSIIVKGIQADALDVCRIKGTAATLPLLAFCSSRKRPLACLVRVSSTVLKDAINYAQDICLPNDAESTSRAALLQALDAPCNPQVLAPNDLSEVLQYSSSRFTVSYIPTITPSVFPR